MKLKIKLTRKQLICLSMDIGKGIKMLQIIYVDIVDINYHKQELAGILEKLYAKNLKFDLEPRTTVSLVLNNAQCHSIYSTLEDVPESGLQDVNLIRMIRGEINRTAPVVVSQTLLQLAGELKQA